MNLAIADLIVVIFGLPVTLIANIYSGKYTYASIRSYTQNAEVISLKFIQQFKITTPIPYLLANKNNNTIRIKMRKFMYLQP